MLKKTIKYVDFNDQVREEVFHFNLSKAELTELEVSHPGGFREKMNRIVEAQNYQEIMVVLKQLIMMSYGEKSEDGRRFIKSEEMSIGFTQTEAYTVLLEELLSDEQAGINFFKALLPASISQNIDVAMKLDTDKGV